MAKANSNLFSKIQGSIYGGGTFNPKDPRYTAIWGKRPRHPDRHSRKQIAVRDAYKRLIWIWRYADWLDPTGYIVMSKKYHYTDWNIFIMHHMPAMSKTPIAYYGIDELAGDIFHDYTADNCGGHLEAVELAKTYHGMGYWKFDGSNSFADIEDIRTQRTDKFTIIMMTKLIWQNRDMALFATLQPAIWLGGVGGQAPNITLKIGDGIEWKYTHTMYAGWTNTIRIIAARWDGMRSKIFVHNLKSDEQEYTGDPFAVDWQQAEAYIGADNTSDGKHLLGSVYNFALYDRALTDEEIEQAMQGIAKWADYARYI